MSRIIKSQIEAENKRNKYTFVLQNQKAQSGHAIHAGASSAVASTHAQPVQEDISRVHHDNHPEADTVKSRSIRYFPMVVVAVVGLIGMISVLSNVHLLVQIKANRTAFVQQALEHDNMIAGMEKNFREFQAASDKKIKGLDARLAEATQAIKDGNAENTRIAAQNQDFKKELENMRAAVTKNDGVITDLINRQSVLQTRVEELSTNNKRLDQQLNAVKVQAPAGNPVAN